MKLINTIKWAGIGLFIYIPILLTLNFILNRSESTPLSSQVYGIRLPFGWKTNNELQGLACDVNYTGDRGFPFKIEGGTDQNSQCNILSNNNLADILNKITGVASTATLAYYLKKFKQKNIK